MKLMGIERKFILIPPSKVGILCTYELDEGGAQSHTNVCKSTPHKETEAYFHSVKVLSCELDLLNHTEEKEV